MILKIQLFLQSNIKLLYKTILLVCFCFLPINIYANENIIIKGNKNIPSTTFYSYAPKKINNLNPIAINEFKKKLFETGFFKKLDVSIINNKILVTVDENPLINFFYIEGIKNNKIRDQLTELSSLKENNFFQEFLIKNDVENFNKFLNNIGYLNAKIDYQIIKIDNNKINFFYQVNLNKKFKINRIFFIGNKFFNNSTLADVISSSEYGWGKFLSNSSTPSEQLVNSDISKLKFFYLNNGFYDIQITSNSIKLINDSKVNLIYSINSGNRYFINKIYIDDKSNSIKKDDLNNIKKFCDSLISENYNLSELKKKVELINNYLNIANYNILVDYDLKKTSNSLIDIKFVILDQPNIKIVEKISITGNNITEDFVIRNNILLAEGDIFNQIKLTSSIDKIKSLEIFKNVKYKIDDSDSNKVNLEINVEEQPTGEISAGAGASNDGATLSGGIKEKNFLGKGILLDGNLNLGTQQILGSISYSNPDFNNSGNNLNTSLYIKNDDYTNSGYESKKIGTSISTNYEIYDKVFLNPGIAIDFDSVSANTDASDLIKKRAGDYTTSKVFYNISKNTTNRYFQPTEGYRLGIGQGFSILSDIPYINNRIFGSFYHEYLDNFVGSIKYKIESINGFNDDIKFSDRLTVSSDNLRGFANRGIGPKLGTDYIGGNYSYYSSLSSTIPNGLPEKWNALTNVFLDTANLWGVDDNSTSDSNKIRTSIGLGLSWISPIGPISITYAEPITKSNTDELEKFSFKIGSAF